MEDYSSLIWIAILGAGALISWISKAAKKSGWSPQEAWPEIFGEIEDDMPNSEVNSPRHSVVRQHDKKTHQEMTNYGSQEDLTPEHTEQEYVDGDYVDGEFVEGYYKTATKSAPTGADRLISRNQTSASINKPMQSGNVAMNGSKLAPESEMEGDLTSTAGQAQLMSEAAQIAGDFDLRKAVIYSELLKPKFEE